MFEYPQPEKTGRQARCNRLHRKLRTAQRLCRRRIKQKLCPLETGVLRGLDAEAAGESVSRNGFALEHGGYGEHGHPVDGSRFSEVQHDVAGLFRRVIKRAVITRARASASR